MAFPKRSLVDKHEPNRQQNIHIKKIKKGLNCPTSIKELDQALNDNDLLRQFKPPDQSSK